MKACVGELVLVSLFGWMMLAARKDENEGLPWWMLAARWDGNEASSHTRTSCENTSSACENQAVGRRITGKYTLLLKKCRQCV